MLILAYDFETSGLPLFDQPSDDPRQPHIVQAAALLVDTDTRQTVASLNMIAYPTDWEIPEEVAKIHGITTEQARAVGVPEALIVQTIRDLWRVADLRCAHNESFDARIMRIGLKRFLGEDEAERWKGGKADCTARLASPIMKLAPTPAMLAAGRRHAKTPNLAEAYQHFTGRKLENAHSALADVKACMAVWFAIKGAAAAKESLHAPIEVVAPPVAATAGADPFGLPPLPGGDEDLSFLK